MKPAFLTGRPSTLSWCFGSTLSTPSRGNSGKRNVKAQSDIWNLQEDLLKEIEERKKLQADLKSKLYKIADAVDLTDEPFQVQPDGAGCPIPPFVDDDGKLKVTSTEGPPVAKEDTKITDEVKPPPPPVVKDVDKVKAEIKTPPVVKDVSKVKQEVKAPPPSIKDVIKAKQEVKAPPPPPPPLIKDVIKPKQEVKAPPPPLIKDVIKAKEEVKSPPPRPPRPPPPPLIKDVIKPKQEVKAPPPPPLIKDVIKPKEEVKAPPPLIKKVKEEIRAPPLAKEVGKKVKDPMFVDDDEIIEETAFVSDGGQHKEPLAGANVMNIVMVGSECAPYSKTGGLADVMGALPKALAARGHRVMVVTPRYANYETAWFTDVRMTYNVFGAEHEVGYFHEFRDGVDFVFIDHPCYHNRGNDLYSGSRLDVAFRCALMSKAALEAPWHVPCGDAVYGDGNLVFIANDWHAALVPFYLQAHYRDHSKMSYARSILILHNMAYQGRGPMAELDNYEVPEHYTDSFQLYDPVGGEHMNILKAAIIHCHRLVAVSHGYAWECQTQEGGWGLDGVLREHSWKLRGIVNGMDTDVWHPSVDPFLTDDAAYATYNINTLSQGKGKCKAALQQAMGLPVNARTPLLGFIGRLDYQKGVDLIQENYDWLMSQNVQIIMLGSGREDLETSLRELEHRNPDKCKSWVGFSVEMAHKITAACDLLLMPSRFEPCGLNQLYAMAYGTVPVVHAVGGLRDTVIPFDPYGNTGTGFTFEWADANAMREAVSNALHTYRDFPDSFKGIMIRGMQQNFSWEHVAEQYEEVLVDAKFQW